MCLFCDHGYRRLIYVIPKISIILQANELGRCNVRTHSVINRTSYMKFTDRHDVCGIHKVRKFECALFRRNVSILLTHDSGQYC